MRVVDIVILSLGSLFTSTIRALLGAGVREALASGRALSELSADELARLAPGLDPGMVSGLVAGGGVLESKV